MMVVIASLTGDRVLLPEYGGSVFKHGDDELVVVREDEIVVLIVFVSSSHLGCFQEGIKHAIS